MTRLILASGSRYKRQQLARLDVPFEAIDADIDESSLPGEAPDALASRLAEAKARALASAHPGAFILGGDQVISVDGEQLHKPGSVERARAQLARLQGRAHDLYCAVALLTPAGEAWHEMVHFEMHMRPLDADAIARYVERDAPLDCAGSYVLEAGGVQLFSSMRGDDYTAIIGLPLTRVHSLLLRAGLAPAH